MILLHVIFVVVANFQPRSSEYRIQMAGFADPMVTINQATRCHSPRDHIWSFRNRRQFISRTIIVTILSLSLLILWTRRTGLVVFTSTDRQTDTDSNLPQCPPGPAGTGDVPFCVPGSGPDRLFHMFLWFTQVIFNSVGERRGKGKIYPTHHLYSWHFGVSVSRMMSTITLTWRFIYSCCQKRCFPVSSFRVACMM